MIELRPFQPADREPVVRVALAAWQQYERAVSDWSRTAALLSSVPDLTGEVELIVATRAAAIVGVVGYVPPGARREAMFPQEWALIRLLSVEPAVRGAGIGRQLTAECVRRARRDGAATIGLHTSPVMASALALYLRMGFVLERQIPDRNGLAYALYTRDVRDAPGRSSIGRADA